MFWLSQKKREARTQCSSENGQHWSTKIKAHICNRFVPGFAIPQNHQIRSDVFMVFQPALRSRVQRFCV